MLREYIKKIIQEESEKAKAEIKAADRFVTKKDIRAFVKKEMDEIVKALVRDAVNTCFQEDYSPLYFTGDELYGHVDRSIEWAFGEKLRKTAEDRVNEVIADESFIDHFVEKINKKQLRVSQ